jgi:hypothetical protein
MSTPFQKFIEKSTKGLFIFIILTMVLPLVLWGYMGDDGSAGPPEEQGTAGTIFGSVKVSKAEYRRAQDRANASYWWGKYEPIPLQYLRFMPIDPPKPEQIAEQAWEDLILVREAKALGLAATEKEVLLHLRTVFQKFTQSYDYKDAIMDRIARDILHTSPQGVRQWAQDAVLIRKLLNLAQDSAFASYEDVYGRTLEGAQVARVRIAELDAADAALTARPPSLDEIAAHYRKQQAKYKTAPKVQVSFLMAETGPLLKDLPEPGPEVVRKYYDDHKAEFVKEHHHEPGEEHREDEAVEYRSFEEAKAEIPDKIRRRAAEKKAAEIMAKADVELGAIIVANGNKVPDDAFDQIKTRFQAQGIELVHDITLPFDAARVEEVEKQVGKDSTLSVWPFGENVKPGEISKRVKTDKGVALFRLNRRIEPVDPGVTDRVREQIVRELRRDQIRKRVKARAEKVAAAVNAGGPSSVDVAWSSTRYFRVGGADHGLEDPKLASAVNRQLQGGLLSAGKAVGISGNDLGSPDAGGAVIYVEDLTRMPPDDVSVQFQNVRRQLDAQAGREYRERFIAETVKAANLQLDPSMKSAERK